MSELYRHVKSLAELSKVEAAEIMEILRGYEGKDYNVYARSVDSSMRSVEHQHTHLIKAKNKKANAFLYLKRPYWVKKF